MAPLGATARHRSRNHHVLGMTTPHAIGQQPSRRDLAGSRRLYVLQSGSDEHADGFEPVELLVIEPEQTSDRRPVVGAPGGDVAVGADA